MEWKSPIARDLEITDLIGRDTPGTVGLRLDEPSPGDRMPGASGRIRYLLVVGVGVILSGVTLAGSARAQILLTTGDFDPPNIYGNHTSTTVPLDTFPWTCHAGRLKILTACIKSMKSFPSVTEMPRLNGKSVGNRSLLMCKTMFRCCSSQYWCFRPRSAN